LQRPPEATSSECLEKAKNFWRCGDKENAERFAQESLVINLSDEAEEFISMMTAMERVLASEDYYDILGVWNDASETDIRRSYLELAQQLHPDKNNAPEAAEAYEKIKNAFAVLSYQSIPTRHDSVPCVEPVFHNSEYIQRTSTSFAEHHDDDDDECLIPKRQTVCIASFMLVLEWLFAIVAFSTCLHFSTTLNYTVTCKNGTEVPVEHVIAYPFQLDITQAVNVTCSNSENNNNSSNNNNSNSENKTETASAYPTGNYKPVAQLFVGTGVASFLLTMVFLVLYKKSFSSYRGRTFYWKNIAGADFIVTAVNTIVWMISSTAWTIGVVVMAFKSDPGNWIFESNNSNNTVCSKWNDTNYVSAVVKNCTVVENSLPGGILADAQNSIIFGFVNVFLWTSNLGLLHKCLKDFEYLE
jgi:curved DNA-binding protein CbpA